jgi:hypothetical protein
MGFHGAIHCGPYWSVLHRLLVVSIVSENVVAGGTSTVRVFRPCVSPLMRKEVTAVAVVARVLCLSSFVVVLLSPLRGDQNRNVGKLCGGPRRTEGTLSLNHSIRRTGTVTCCATTGSFPSRPASRPANWGSNFEAVTRCHLPGTTFLAAVIRMNSPSTA